MNSLVSDRRAFSRESHIMHKVVLLPTFVLVLSVHTSQADSATWNLNPTSSIWYTASNWTPATVPNTISDAATFGVSNVTAIFDAPGGLLTNLGTFLFNEGASA